ncbi:pyridoxal phosphate-dependent decarboxylase family protein [Embleya sp. NPDC020630]|uniref:pyridoxal phosphate-dependent decarboxylase family protein n=1 Tax=Embleya sp. NPDC020630 TaxID=3363979 RepID=UPI003792C0C5
MDTRRRLTEAFDTVSAWADAQREAPPEEGGERGGDRFEAHLAALAEHLRGGRPFPHPAYAGHLVRPPHRAAVAGRLATSLVGPEDRVFDGDPTTVALEEEVIADLAAMLGLPIAHGHLTSGGTVANLEALWAAREAHPDLGIAHGADMYPAHEHMCAVLRTPAYPVPTDGAGRMDPDALARELRRERVGTVVVSAGTTTLGAVDPIADIVPLCRERGVRVHADAAYGGFFTLLVDADELRATPAARHLRALAECDSVVVDPHRIGLYPSGCGAVLFREPVNGAGGRRDPRAGDFSADVLRPGELGLDRARSGTLAAALWLTLRALPLSPVGVGSGLAAGLRGTRQWCELIEDEPELMLFQRPELDILTFLALTGERHPRMSRVEASSGHILRAGTAGAEPLAHLSHLSTLSVRVLDFLRRHPRAVADRNRTRVLRSALLDPAAESCVPDLHARITALAAAAPRRASSPDPGAAEPVPALP